jgi:acyl-CoA thioesterase
MTDRDVSFDSLLAGIDGASGRAVLRTPAQWAQGRATYGGLVAAAGLRAMRAAVEPQRTPRSVHVTFVAPVAPGEVEIRVRTLRQGKSATVVQADFVQEGNVCTVVVGSFGAARATQVRLEAPARPLAPPPEDGPVFPYVEGLTPVFTQHFQYRWVLGGLPFTGSHDRFIGGWCAYGHEREVMTHEHILGLLDAWPPTVLAMMETPAPGSTLTWAVQFLPWTAQSLADEWWFYRAEADAAGDGYAHTHAMLWDPHGRPAAISVQTVAVFG